MAAEPEHLTAPAEMAASSSPPATAGDGQRERGRIGKRGAPQAFARKLAEILTTESTATISWNANGSAFQVHDVERFSEDILTKYYRHSKFSSFQRQLNLYSFRKIVKGADAGGYAHPMFRRDRPDDLYHVRRSISGSARYEPAAAAAKATAKRNAAASKAAALKQQATGGEWSPPARVHKSGAAARRVGKLRNKSSPAGGSNSSSRGGGDKPSSYSARLVADHQRAGVVATAAAAAAGAPGSGGGGVGIPASSAADAAAGSSDAGERSPWTSGESSDSDAAASLPQAAGVSAASAERRQQLQQQRKQQQARRGGTAAAAATDSSGDEASSSEDSDEDCVGRSHEQQQHALERGGRLAEKQQEQARRSYSPSRRDTPGEVAGECGRGGGEGTQQLRDGGEAPAGAGSASPTHKSSPFSFFKKFSFMERQSSSGHNRNMSTSSSVDMTTAGALPSERPASSAGNDGPISPLMVDTSAEARAAASGASLRGVRPPPVTVTGGGQRIPIDPSTAAGNKALTSSPLTPKSSLEAAAMATAAAAAAASAMPPPPKREQREELGLVEQLTNMVEVFDICDLLRKVSTSGSSRLDKHGAIVKPSGGGGGGGGPHHLRNMSVDTDQGMPQSPLGGGQSPTGLGSLASMELVRDSSKDWDTLMAGSADVSDLGNTMVQSVAEFFSF